MYKPIVILAIESSCDDTGVALIENGTIISNTVFNQDVHAQFGGVIPEEASRQHLNNLMPVVLASLKESRKTIHDLSAIAFTQRPGLMGSLLVGASFAKSIAQVINIPLIAVNHMEAHVLSNLIEEPKPSFPFLCLTVSGGHTQLVVCKSPLEQEIIGKTIDDAAGEAFDKAAKMLGLAYPGGPLIDKNAALGNPKLFQFAKPNIEALNYSFSGIKTSILYFLQKQTKENPNFIKENLFDLCASIQHSIVEILLKKLIKASQLTGIKQIAIAGGVSANKALRKGLELAAEKNNWTVFVPDFKYCTDNAAMIAITAHFKFLNQEFVSLETEVSAR